MRSLIIDDESVSRSRINRLLATQPDVQVIGEAANGMKGLELIVSLMPDLIFLDIGMPVLNGLQMLRSIPEGTPIPLVIFITGYDEHALAAFEADALAYLLKPVDEERLATAVGRARRILSEPAERVAESRRIASAVAQRSIRMDQIVGKKHDRFFFLRPVDIVYFSAEDGVVKGHTAMETYLVAFTLNDLEQSLTHLQFFRAHRSALVNLSQVREIQPSFRSSFVLLLADRGRTEIHVSERQAKVLRERTPGL